ncbi:MAG: dihydroxyacetone kinase subunit L [Acidobacteria bacterium]|nr:MAG: dihydroxyacetone kinase subunit L [Acidobacteriota bacterium]
MVTTLCIKELLWMMGGAIEKVKCEHKVLSELDSACGDGDHGTTMLRATNQLEKVMTAHQSDNLQGLLSDMGWTVLGIDGGATGPLLGSFFTGMSESVAGKQTLDTEALTAMFEAGLNALKKQTKAQVGDKTLMDALVPAVAALRAGAEANKEILQILREAAAAAQEGAYSTKNLKARFGRAKYLGDRTLGHQDPGATSISLMFQGFYDGLSTKWEL